MTPVAVSLNVVAISSVSPTTPGIECTGFSLELAGQVKRVHLPIYRRTDTELVRISDYLLNQADLPFPTADQPFYSVQTPQGSFVPLEGFVCALYQRNQAADSLMSFLAEFRAPCRYRSWSLMAL